MAAAGDNLGSVGREVVYSLSVIARSSFFQVSFSSLSVHRIVASFSTFYGRYEYIELSFLLDLTVRIIFKQRFVVDCMLDTDYYCFFCLGERDTPYAINA